MSNPRPTARELFDLLVELESHEARSVLLTEKCYEDEELRLEVESLLVAHEQAKSFLESPPLAGTADVAGSAAEGERSRIGPYRLMEQIGEGGFGRVFVAEQQQPVRRMVAVKLIKPGMDSREVIARFNAERQALALMDHPNIAKVLDAGATASGHPYFVMELVRGVPITDYCDQNALTPRQRIELFVAVCHAVQHAHQKGIIHRDIKPTNVLVTTVDGRPIPKVIDFGVAKAIHQPLTDFTVYTRFHQMLGTPLYMSPEQAEMTSADIDTRSDIYSLGVLLYELIVGSTPFDRKRFAQVAFDEIRRIIREEDPPRPSTRLSESGERIASIAAQRGMEPARLSRMIQGDLDWIVMKSLEKDRSRRYSTAENLAKDMERFLHHEPVEAGPVSAAYRIRKFVRRKRGPLITGASLISLLLAGTVVSVWQAVRASRAERSAVRALDSAQSNLDLAIRAVDEFGTQVSEDLRLQAQDLRPLRKELLLKAVKFHEELLRRRGSTESARQDVARSYHKLALLTGEIGEPDRAIDFYQSAIDELGTVAREVANDSQTQVELAVMLGEVAHLLIDRGQSSEGLARLDQGIHLLNSILKLHPEQNNTRFQLANLRALRAYAYEHTQRLDQAVSESRQAIEQLRRLTTQNEDSFQYVSHLAHAHWKVADILLQQRLANWRQAETELADALTLQRQCVDRPGATAEDWALLAAILKSDGHIKSITGRFENATDLFHESIAVLQRLCTEQPSVTRFRAELAHAHLALSRCRNQTGDLDQVQAALNKAKELLEGVVVQAPGNSLYECRLADVLYRLGDLALRSGAHEPALADFDRSVQLLDGVLRREPESLNSNAFLPAALIGRAKALVHCQRYNEALADCDRAIQAKTISDQSRDANRLERSRVRVLSGDYLQAVAEAQEVLKTMSDRCAPRFMTNSYLLGAEVCGRAAALVQVDTTPSETERQRLFQEYAAQVVTWLKCAMDAGLTDIASLQDAPEFSAVRDQPPFVSLFNPSPEPAVTRAPDAPQAANTHP